MSYKQIAAFAAYGDDLKKANEFLKKIQEKNNLSSILFEKDRIYIVYFESDDKNVL